MARTDAQVNQRMPQALKAMLVEAAKLNRRSLTEEINSRLERSFESSESTITSASDVPNAAAMLMLDRKLSALCDHLGVKSAK
jgi:uncharacterized protein (DUF1778 family)